MLEKILDIQSIQNKAALSESERPFAAIFPSNIHICHFYESKSELLELLIPFFVEGLRRSEFCLWGVGAPLTVPSAYEALDAALEGDLGGYLAKEQIEIFDISEFYGIHTFDAMAVKDAFISKIYASMKKGWNGFRCDGMASGLAPGNWRNYQTYEEEITRSLMPPTTALCSYNLTHMTAQQVIQVVSTHQASILRQDGTWRVFQSVEHVLTKENKQKEKEFREMADTMAQLAWVANAFGTITWYNRRWHEYTGIRPDQIKGDGWHAAYDQNQLNDIMEKWKSSIKNGKSFEMVMKIKGSDGIYRPFLTRAMTLSDQNGKVRRWFGTCTDLSDIIPLLSQPK